MKKLSDIIIREHESIDDIVVCKKCLIECDYGQNDWDSFYTCSNCGKSTFIGELKTLDAQKVSKSSEIIRFKRE